MPGRDLRLDLLAGAIGDKYEMLRLIGSGGMGSVFAARHRLHGGLVAVKVLAEHLAANTEIVRRFLQEARALALLSGHPHILPIIDVEERKGLYVLIIPYLEGEDLGAYLKKKGRLPCSEACGIGAQIADGLAFAHAKGVIHRDLKPGNLFMASDGRVVILDFGIAKVLGAATTLTRTGSVFGTPHYMAPEQILGKPCDGRTDLYALGVVLFELMAGGRPFEGGSPRAIEDAHLSQPVPKLSARDGSIPLKCSEMVARLLNKDPALRYPGANDLLKDLRALASPAPTAMQQLPKKSAEAFSSVPSAFSKQGPIMQPPGLQDRLRGVGGDIHAALAKAVIEGETEIARFLVAKGAQVDGYRMGSWTPLMLAVYEGRARDVRHFIEAGADVNLRDAQLQTPLMNAALMGFVEIVRLLIEAGADVNARDDVGRTALRIAESQNRSAIVDLLNRAGAKS